LVKEARVEPASGRDRLLDDLVGQTAAQRALIEQAHLDQGERRSLFLKAFH
jgi:hypothetical protein